jgi:hypothetical protein
LSNHFGKRVAARTEKGSATVVLEYAQVLSLGAERS